MKFFILFFAFLVGMVVCQPGEGRAPTYNSEIPEERGHGAARPYPPGFGPPSGKNNQQPNALHPEPAGPHPVPQVPPQFEHPAHHPVPQVPHGGPQPHHGPEAHGSKPGPNHPKRLAGPKKGSKPPCTTTTAAITTTAKAEEVTTTGPTASSSPTTAVSA